MSWDKDFDSTELETLIGGLALLDVKRLNTHNLEEAQRFLLSYGFDTADDKDVARLWNHHRRAATFLQTRLLAHLPGDEKIPEMLTDPAQLRDLRYLLIYASGPQVPDNLLQKWSCALLKVMHVLVHLEHDLYTAYSSQIQDQIMRVYQDHVYADLSTQILQLGTSNEPNPVPLKRFETRPFKTSSSAVTKLLARPDEVAFGLLDRMGVRFVTRNVFDVFRVLKYLTDQNIISFPNVIPSQSSNNLYPHELLLEEIKSWSGSNSLTETEIEERLKIRLQKSSSTGGLRRKFNPFSSSEYRFVKFIVRKLIRVDSQPQPISFFYPYEVQILDYASYLGHLTGPSSHEEYKRRQLRQAHLRLFGEVGKFAEEKNRE